MTIAEMEGTIEALLFTKSDELHISKIAEILEQDIKTTVKLIESLNAKYMDHDRGIRIIEYNNSYQMVTNPQYYKYIEMMAKIPSKKTLTQTQLEALAIIAYKQPITKTYIEEIRGVNADHVVNKLVELNLVEEKGRLDSPGKPILFGTTKEFLRYFGIKNLSALPSLPAEIESLRLEAEKEVEKNII